MSNLPPPPTSSTLFMKRRRAFVACANCRKRKIKCATMADGDCRPCTRCAVKGLKCEYVAVDESQGPPPTTVACANCRKSKIKVRVTVYFRDFNAHYNVLYGVSLAHSSSTQHRHQWTPPPPQERDNFADDGEGRIPQPITPPSAGINEYLGISPPSSRAASPRSHSCQSPYYSAVTSPASTSRAQHAAHYSAPYPSTHPLPEPTRMPHHPDEAATAHYADATLNFATLNAMDPNHFDISLYGYEYVPPSQRTVAYPSTWPQMLIFREDFLAAILEAPPVSHLQPLLNLSPQYVWCRGKCPINTTRADFWVALFGAALFFSHPWIHSADTSSVRSTVPTPRDRVSSPPSSYHLLVPCTRLHCPTAMRAWSAPPAATFIMYLLQITIRWVQRPEPWAWPKKLHFGQMRLAAEKMAALRGLPGTGTYFVQLQLDPFSLINAHVCNSSTLIRKIH
ncbi:hypothetical protein B0H13DRAFT_1896251 [Mycena leptocephala]|nr:hypothetical protein B0H13DRAFT_1896251 [Mycena leptocephala]